MVKIRIHGASDEVKDFLQMLKKIENDGAITILSESGVYQDRGSSKLVRIYIDVDMEGEK